MKYIIFTILFTISVFSQDKAQLKSLVSEGKQHEAVKLIQPNSYQQTKDVELLVLCGDIFYYLDDYANANNFYSAAYKINDENLDAGVKAATTIDLTGKTKEARELLDDILDEDDKYIPAYIAYAESYIREKDNGKATMWIDRGIDKDDKNSSLYLAKGNMYFNKGVYELSKDAYLEALALDEMNTQARFNLATSYYWLAQRESSEDLSSELFKKALTEWAKVSELDPNNAKSFFQQGKILFLAKKYADAAPKLNRFIQMIPDDKLGRWYLAQSLSEIGRCDSASQHLEWVSNNIDSVKIKSRLLLAQCYAQNKNYTEAIQTYSNIVKDTTLSTIDLKLWANSYLQSGDTVNAIAKWDELLAIDSENNCGLITGIGQLYLVKKEYAKAINYFLKKLSLTACDDPQSDSKIYRFLGISFINSALDTSITKDMKGSFLKDAEKYLNEGLVKYPGNGTLMISLGDVYASMGDNDKAIAKYLELIQVAKTTPVESKDDLRNAYSKLCGIYSDSKNWTKLTSICEEWNGLQPDSELAAIYCAIAYHQKYAASQADADKNSACNWYNKVLLINAENQTAKKNLSALGC